MQSKLEARLSKLSDSFKGSSQRYGSYTVTNIGAGMLRVDGQGYQGTETGVAAWLQEKGIKQ